MTPRPEDDLFIWIRCAGAGRHETCRALGGDWETLCLRTADEK